LELMNIKKIFELLPHRFPFLLVDRVIALDSGKYIKAVKNVSFNEPFFTGHFPGDPVFPGVLITEALAQAAGILSFEATGMRPDGKTHFYLVGLDNARFKQPVIPGDQLMLEIEYVKDMRGIWKFKGTASVDGKVVATADIMCAARDSE